MKDESTHDENEEKSHEYRATRRDTLKAGSVGAFGFFLFDGFSLRNEDTVEIPVGVHGDKVLNTRQVPRSWYEHVTSARDVFDRLHDKYKRSPWYDYVAQTAASDQIAGLNKHQVKVYATDTAAARTRLPNQVNGVTVSVGRSRERHLDGHLSSTCDENTGTYNCVPGGGYLRDNASGGHGCWTSTCIAKDSGGTHHLMTSRHPFGDCGDDVSGEPVYNGKNDPKYVGDVQKYSHKYDATLVGQGGDVSGIDNKIIGQSYPVRGHVSESYCDTLISNYDTTFHTGISTGETTGYLDEKVKLDMCGESVEFLKLGTNAGDGDSGGPHYWINEKYDYIAILGPHRSHTTSNATHQRSFCPAGYAMNNDLGWKFGDTSSTC